MKGCGTSPHPLKAAPPGTRDCVSRCSATLHTASHRLAKRNRSVALRSLFMSGLDAPVSPCLQFRPSATALRRPNSHVGMSEGWCSNSTVCASSRTPFYLESTASRREPAAAYGLAPYAICVRLQHRPSDERPLQPRCELQRHHPQEGRLRVYIYLFFGSSRAAARPISYVIH